MDELDARGRTLEAERARPDCGERPTSTVPELMSALIHVLAEALLGEDRPYAPAAGARERIAAYDRLRGLGFSRDQAAADLGIGRSTSYTYERLRQGAA